MKIRGGLYRRLGILIVIASLAFLAQRIWASKVWRMEELDASSILSIGLLGAIIFATACFFLSTAWCLWLRWLGAPDVRYRVCHGIYGRAHIARYLPGNVFHIVSRHVAGRTIGFSHASLIGATLFEITGVLSAATAVGIAGLATYGLDHLAHDYSPLLGVAALGVLLLPLALAAASRLMPQRMQIPLPSGSVLQMLLRMAPPYLCYVLFMVVAGVVLDAILRFGVQAEAVPPVGAVVGVVGLAWAIGYATPGASAGIGVRDSLIVIGLTPFTGERSALMAALILRLSTFVGDLLYFAIALLFPTNGTSCIKRCPEAAKASDSA